MTQPSRLPEWASEDTQVYFDSNDDGVEEVFPNKREANPQWRKHGYLFTEYHPADYLNFELNLITEWIAHQKDKYVVGDTKTTTTSEDAATISQRLGGTWILVGTEVLAGETNNVFRKTA